MMHAVLNALPELSRVQPEGCSGPPSSAAGLENNYLGLLILVCKIGYPRTVFLQFWIPIGLQLLSQTHQKSKKYRSETLLEETFQIISNVDRFGGVNP